MLTPTTGRTAQKSFPFQALSFQAYPSHTSESSAGSRMALLTTAVRAHLLEAIRHGQQDAVVGQPHHHRHDHEYHLDSKP